MLESEWYPAARRGRIVALFMTAIAICSFAGSLVSGAIMQAFDGAMGLAGWQWLFLIEALPALGIGVYYLLRLTDNIQAATWLQPEEKAVLAAQLSSEESDVPAGTFKAAFQDWRVWVACLIYMMRRAWRIGGISVSQFSREYARMFGALPRRRVEALRG